MTIVAGNGKPARGGPKRKAPGKRGRPAKIGSGMVGAHGFEPGKLVRQTLNDLVYQQVKEAIMSGNLHPGSILTIRDLASSFGVSMMPVREALSRLIAEQALEFMPNRSVAVPIMSTDRFDQVTDVRILLEGLAVRTAVPQLDKATVRTLARTNKEMEVTGWSDREEFLRLNRSFHFTIYRASGQDFLVNLIESLWLQVGPLLNFLRDLLPHDSKGVVDHHKRFLKAVAAGDADAAARAICDDIRTAAIVIRPLIEEQSGGSEVADGPSEDRP